MKKKIIMLLMTVLTATTLIGCGTSEYKRVHVDTYHYNGCFTIEKWYHNSIGIDVETKEFGTLSFSEGQYILIEDECPFCE